MRLVEHEVEQFEDDPLEYVRIDLSFASSASGGGVGGLNAEGTTRRQAAADVLRALVSSGFEAHTTEVVGSFINRGLQSYNANRSAENAWQSKDSAVYLLTAVATRGATAQVSDSRLSINHIEADFSKLARCHCNECPSRCRSIFL